MISLDEVRLRAERAEYTLDRIRSMVEDLSVSIEDPWLQGYIGGLAKQIATMEDNLYIEHERDPVDDVCNTCPRNHYGARVGWDYLHPRA